MADSEAKESQPQAEKRAAGGVDDKISEAAAPAAPAPAPAPTASPKKDGFGSKLSAWWAGLGLDLPTFLTMLK